MATTTTTTTSAALTTLRLAHTPAHVAVHIALFTDVRNAAALRAQLLAGNPDFEFAFVDAALILSPTHLLAAIFRATTDLGAGRLRTRNVHSEIVFALGASNNIASTLKTFGISASSSSLVAVKLTSSSSVLSSPSVTTTSPSPAQQEEQPAAQTTTTNAGADPGAGFASLSTQTAHDLTLFLQREVSGSMASFTAQNLAAVRDLAAIRSAYKISPALSSAPSTSNSSGGGVEGEEGRKSKRARGPGGAEKDAGLGLDSVPVVEAEDEEIKMEVRILGMLALRGA